MIHIQDTPNNNKFYNSLKYTIEKSVLYRYSKIDYYGHILKTMSYTPDQFDRTNLLLNINIEKIYDFNITKKVHVDFYGIKFSFTKNINKRERKELVELIQTLEDIA